MLAILKTYKDNRYLIKTWVKFNIQANYIEAKLGLLWLVILPIVQALIYTFFFSLMLDAPTRDNLPFVLFYLSGLTTWQLINSSWMKAGSLMLRNGILLSNVSVSAEAIVITEFLENCVDFFISFIIMVIVAALYGFYPTTTYFFFPIILFFMVLASMGGMFFLSSLSVFIRDIPNITSIMMRLLIFLSGVFMSPEMMNENYSKYLYLNPILHFIQATRDLLLLSEIPSTQSFLYMGASSILMFYFGYKTFKKRQGRFVDYM